MRQTAAWAVPTFPSLTVVCSTAIACRMPSRSRRCGSEVATGTVRGRTCCGGWCQGRHSAASCGGLVGRGLGDALRAFGTEVLVCPRCDPEGVGGVGAVVGWAAVLAGAVTAAAGGAEFGG